MGTYWDELLVAIRRIERRTGRAEFTASQLLDELQQQGTCRDEILRAVDRIEHRTGRAEFTVPQILDELQQQGRRYTESTIRTHVISRMCSNSPDHHEVVYGDFVRIGRGLYRRRS